jgi:hypothetical protein
LGAFQIQDVGTGLYLSFTGGDLLPGQDITQNLGSSSLRWNDIYGQNALINTSDKNQKKDIQESDLGLGFILNLKPVSFRWENGKRKHYGLLAQDVKECLGEQDFGGYIFDPESEVHGLRYTEFLSPLIKSVQEIDKKINTQYFTVAQLIQESNKDLAQSIPIRLIYSIDSQLQEYKERLKDDVDKVKELEDKHNKLNYLLSYNNFNIESQIKDLKVEELKDTITNLETTLADQIKIIQVLTERAESLEESNKAIHQYIGEWKSGQDKVKKDKKVKEEPQEEIPNIETKVEPLAQLEIKKLSLLDTSKEWFKNIFKNPFKRDC